MGNWAFPVLLWGCSTWRAQCWRIHPAAQSTPSTPEAANDANPSSSGWVFWVRTSPCMWAEGPSKQGVGIISQMLPQHPVITCKIIVRGEGAQTVPVEASITSVKDVLLLKGRDESAGLVRVGSMAPRGIRTPCSPLPASHSLTWL